MGLILFYPEDEKHFIATYPYYQCREEFIVKHQMILTINNCDLYILREMRRMMDIRPIRAGEDEQVYLNQELSLILYKVYTQLRSKNHDFKGMIFYVHINGKNFTASMNNLAFEQEAEVMVAGTHSEMFHGFLKVFPKEKKLTEAVRLFYEQFCDSYRYVHNEKNCPIYCIEDLLKTDRLK